MKLRFPANKIAYWAQQYDYPQQKADPIDMVPQVKKCGFLTLEQLRLVARWKSPRSAGRVETNGDEFVQAITGFSLRTPSERARIEVLTVLDGVGWPTASVILHFFHPEKYPIMDFRALWSVSVDVPPQYAFPFWWKYVEFCRNVAECAGHDMRTLDRALWAFSARNQPVEGK